MTKATTGRFLVAGAAAFWGMWSLCFRNAERLALPMKLSAAAETFVVFAVMFVATLPLWWFTRARSPPPARTARHWFLLGALGVADAANAGIFFAALQHTTVAVAVLTHYLQPLLVALFAPLVIGERWRARTFGALGLALAGLVLLLRPWATSLSSLDGPALGALSAVFFATTVFLGKGLGARFTVMELACFPRVTSMAVLALGVPVGGFAIAGAPLGVLVVGGLLFGAVPLVMFYRGLATTPASQAGVLTLCEPLVAVLVGAVVWHESMSALSIVGGALVLGGAFWISRSEPVIPAA